MDQMFYGTGPSAWLITLFGIKVIISIIGSTLNGTLAYVILRNNLVICAIGPKIDASLVNYLILGMNFGSICAYLAVWIRIKFAVGNYTDYQTHLLKCLFVLLLLELFGWTFS
uniref:NADH:ubiquinone reductase (H(+)-translocating) n=1 Tax=Meloidogyne javanica TaxID=6303 RepID=A0A915N048_MELJA